MGHCPITGVLRREIWSWRHREGPVTTEVETGETRRQAEDRQGVLAAERSEERAKKDPSLHPSEGAWPYQHHHFRFLAF